MIARISFSVALAIATFCATEASSQSFLASAGRPVAAADISGKKFCWENGKTTTFAAGGQFTNETGHLTRWLISEPGVVKTGWRYRQIVVFPDGRFASAAWRPSVMGGGAFRLPFICQPQTVPQ